MSNEQIAALVCEGQTDVPVFRALIQRLWPSVGEILCLQPELDEMDRAKGPGGWSQVKRWCESHAAHLPEVLRPDVGDPIHLLVIAIDADVAIATNLHRRRKSGTAKPDARALRNLLQGWLQVDSAGPLPREVVLSTPVVEVEAWIVAALFPSEKAPETIADPTAFLVRRRRLLTNPRTGKPSKELHRYQEFGSKVAQRLRRVRASCPEADRTARSIERLTNSKPR